MKYLLTKFLVFLRRYPLEFQLIIVRTIIGFIVGLLLTLISMTGIIVMLAEYIGIHSWVINAVILGLTYIPTIKLSKSLGASKKFDVYLRGASTYFSAAIIAHALTA